MSLELWSELVGFGLGIAFSPLHLLLVLLLLLGPAPLQRAALLLLCWLVTSALAVEVPLGLGHGLPLTLEPGSPARTGLDLLAAGVLLGLGLRSLLPGAPLREGPGAGRLERLVALPLPPLLLLSSALQVTSPEDLFLYARTAGGLLAAGLPPHQELLAVAAFCLITASLLVLPVLALLLLGRERALPLIARCRSWLEARGETLLAVLSLLLALYLGEQGLAGLLQG